MKKRNKNELAKIALTAFILSASLPAGAYAGSDAESHGTLLAGGACGASAPRQYPKTSGCGASMGNNGSTGNNAPKFSGCGASAGDNAPQSMGNNGSTGSNAPKFSGCGASSGNNTPRSSGCGASSGNNTPRSSGCGASSSNNAQGRPNRPSPESYRSQSNARHQPMSMEDNMQGTSANRQSGSMMDSGSSSYQGTTSGPGPNGGYPATPRGSYETDYQQNAR